MLIAGAAWTCCVFASLIWNLNQGERQTLSLARNEAVANFNKDQALRLWATAHGGVFTSVTVPAPVAALEKLRPIRRNRLRGAVWGVKL